jgi:hypothetical protein
MSIDEPEPFRVPDLIEPVIGFRQWRLTDDGLYSLTSEELWRSPRLDALCRVGGHPHEVSPTAGCSCGVYAWYEPCPRAASAATRNIVAGTVVMWGAIELHVDGMRAQHCRIAAVALPLSRWGKRDRVRRAAARLGVPTVRHRDLWMAGRMYGVPVPAGLRPPRTRPCSLAVMDRRRPAGYRFSDHRP